MSKLRLRLLVNGDGRSRSRGALVDGTIEVGVLADCACRKLCASLGWSTGGDSTPSKGRRVSQVVGSGEWMAGQRLSFPFSLEVPTGPPTYGGVLFDVAWSVRADASMAWAFDVREEVPLLVAPIPVAGDSLEKQEDSGRVLAGCVAAAGVLVVGGLVTLLVVPRIEYRVGGLAALIGGAACLWMVPAALANWRIGAATVEAGPTLIPRGEGLACRVTLRPRKEVAPTRLVAELTAVESSVKGAGRGSHVRRVEIARSETVLEGPASVPEDAEGTWAGVLAVPVECPPTVEAGPHGVSWTLRVKVELPGLPDPTWSIVIRVT